MTTSNMPARNLAPRKASRRTNSSAVTTSTHPPRARPSSVCKASKAPLPSAVMPTSADPRMTSHRPTNTEITETWRGLQGILFESSASPPGTTWKTLRTCWGRALLSCKVSATSSPGVNTPSFKLRLTSISTP